MKIVLFGLGVLLWLLLGSCNSRIRQVEQVESNASISLDGFDPPSSEGIQQLYDENSRNGLRLQYEGRWLKIRAKIVEAELNANRAKSAVLKLSREMAKFGVLDQRIPHNEGFINDRERALWNARLKISQDEHKHAQARVRLLRRDLDELNQEISTEGFVSPEITILKE